jgi:hypothetical protein
MLITQNSEIIPYEKMHSSFDVSKIAAFIEAAELKFIKPILGTDLYNDITIAYQDSIKEVSPVVLDEEYINLIHYVRRPLAQLALAMGSSSMAVNVTNNGINRTEDQNHKTAYQYQELNWKRDKMNLGLEFLDELGDFLESEKSTYLYYEDSPERLLRIGMFVSSSKILTAHAGINVGKYIHTLLHSQFTKAERKVKKIIGIDEFTILKTALLNSIPAAKEDAVEMIREAVSNLALAQAIPLLRLKVDAQGVTMVNNEKTKSIEVNKPVRDDQAKDLLENLTATGEAALLELKEMYLVEEENSAIEETTEFTQPKGVFIT